MKKTLQYILLGVISLFVFTGCDVHEFPKEPTERTPFLLHLHFDDSEMVLHKEIPYDSRSGDEGSKAVVRHDIRYVIHAYRTDNVRDADRVPDEIFFFSKSDISDLNYTAQLELPEGTYDFLVWADYVDAGKMSDKYYLTSNFAKITLASEKNHAGSNEFREAFRGYASATVKHPSYYSGPILESIDNQATAEMQRPMGKFKFISTDVEVFINRVVQLMKEQGRLTDADLDGRGSYVEMLQHVKLEDFTVKFRYDIFMPCTFNMFGDKPTASWEQTTFLSKMFTEDNKEMTLGFDYVFVNGTHTTLSLSLYVYDEQGELMASSYPVDVQIVRNKLTVVKGEFLTSKASGGVSISPGYEGKDYDIFIQ